MPSKPKPRKGIVITDKSVTQRASGPNADINSIMARARGGMLPTTGLVGGHMPRFADLVGLDYHRMLNHVIATKERFRSLPSKVRSRFSNDPGALLNFLADPNNRGEAEKLGLVEPKPEPVRPVEGPGDGSIPL